ncbi:murein L,D-transpeptidase family protein [Pseudovibrio sp. Tun.PSC04-5.I4]|uniref:L,D-transpeptidase family protein n=1 Tax=Pseudovibrio sp. Tun.PSC04-5.I4 TaxID=1798213 RepID=UPI000888E5B4|nr:murein L,D-transpeptidase family protein [Pseudovibrio sp. Tun.PSC04-5.I4]SDR37835.1 Murein L,D-transpeptidase YafK [Pseudovibrio sp. Tun.PSC04-5.I4]
MIKAISRPILLSLTIAFLMLSVVFLAYLMLPYNLPGSANLTKVKQERLPALQAKLTFKNQKLGNPVFLRVLKQEKRIEVWMKSGETYSPYKDFEICKYSGDLGPKLKEGDGQSPEGFYNVSEQQLNPNSRYHLSFNLGFPNAFDRSQGRTGSYLMVHGNCVSIGCYAMTNTGIEEIYLLMEAALQNGQQQIPVHIFPFAMTPENMQRHASSNWMNFWQNLKQGYDLFERTKTPPTTKAYQGHYEFSI